MRISCTLLDPIQSTFVIVSMSNPLGSPLSLSTLPPATRAVLTSSTGTNPSNSTNSNPSSPASTSSHGALSHEGYAQNSGRTPRPGTSLININAASNTASGSRSNQYPGEHVANYEPLTYGVPDDGDELASPSPSLSSSVYRSQQYHAYSSQLRHSPSAQLQANRAAAGLSSMPLDPYSPSNGHILHTKGSNLSSNTFIAASPRDRDPSRDRDREDASLLSAPTVATPTPGHMTPFTPSITANQASNPERQSTPRAAPDTSSSTNATLQASQTAPSGHAAHPNVARAKGAASSASGSTQTPRASSRKTANGRERERDREDGHSSRRPKIRTHPRLPHGPADPAPPTLMYWSLAPVYGQLPTRSMRAHSVTLVENSAWLFGGCDERGCARDVWCCDVETFQWTHPPLTGDIPPPCRAHTATLVDGKRIFIFGGGEGPTYYNSLYILDTQTRRFTWVPCGQKPGTSVGGLNASSPQQAESPSTNPNQLPTPNPSTPSKAHNTLPSTPSNTPPPMPLPRRAHTAVLYKHKLYIFGGGNGIKALNDVWSLDTSVPIDRMRWEQVHTQGQKPGPRGYHTANLVGNIMIVVGGSDGRDCFSDIWVLNLDTFVWTLIDTDTEHKRLSHSSTQVGSYLFIMGGHDGVKYSSDLLLFNLVTLQYEHKVTMGRPPPARGYHISLLADAKLFVFGGFDGHSVYDDVWILDLAGAAYLPQVTSFALLIDGNS